jgi:hypothetical protein
MQGQADVPLGDDRGISVGRDASGNAFVTGDNNQVRVVIYQSVAEGREVEEPSEAEMRDRGVAKVFISSTSEDLKRYRTAARDAAIAAGFLPIQMEYFAASGQHPPLQACMEKVAEADVVVLITAHRYGWVRPGSTASVSARSSRRQRISVGRFPNRCENGNNATQDPASNRAANHAHRDSSRPFHRHTASGSSDNAPTSTCWACHPTPPTAGCVRSSRRNASGPERRT